MPTVYTHYKFGQDVLSQVNKKLNQSINQEISYYNMFNQGWDNLFYYHLKWSYYRNFAIRAHKKDVPLFFQNIIEYIKDNHLSNNPFLTNMLYGFLNHYILDTLMHPLINYQVENLNIPHVRIEYNIDKYLFYQEYPKWQNKLYKTLIPQLKFPEDLTKLIDYTFLNTHNISNIGKIFNKSHNNGYLIYRYFIQDTYGLKSKLYKLVDFITPQQFFKFNEFAFYIKHVNLDILNTTHTNWQHPTTLETYNYSFDDLYHICSKIAIKFNNDAFKVLNNKLSITEFIANIKLINLKNIPKLLSL